MSHSSQTSSSKHRKRATMSLQVHPTLGVPFTMTCSPNVNIDKFKEDISDRIGISPRKMALLHQSQELKSGTLSENGVQNGGEIRLIPSLESGVNTATSMDPVAMMKHSMSGISDQQIDDFLAGKSPLSVAIRLGESVVVVNLNRAKVEEVEVEPPPKKYSVLGAGTDSSRTGSHSSSLTGTSTSGINASSLNTNPHWSSSAACTASTSSVTTPSCTVPVRSVIPAGTPAPSVDGGSPTTHLDNTIDHQHDLLIRESATLPSNRRRPRDNIDSSLTSSLPSPSISSHIPSPPSTLSSSSSSSSSLPPSPLTINPCSSRPMKKAVRRMSAKSSKPAKVQLSHTEWEELKRLKEIPSSQNGVSMKRKAVMEAIGEILKKMYAQRARGKVPGTFKGRFSSEFTCDNDMQEIIHSKTTMTSYGDPDVMGHHSRRRAGDHLCSGSSQFSRIQFEENEVLKNKVALLKWKMQQQRAIRKLKRERVDKPSPCGWMEAIDFDLEAPPPKMRKKTGFCGMKSGFLLSD